MRIIAITSDTVAGIWYGWSKKQNKTLKAGR